MSDNQQTQVPDIIAIGEPLLEFNQLVREDGTAHYVPGFGGDTSNFAVAAARQGAGVGMCTRLGEDSFGDEFMQLWQREGIDTALVDRDPAAPTAIYFVTHSEAGHAFTYFRAGSAASHLSPDNAPLDTLKQAKVVHLSAITQAISTTSCDAAFAAIDAVRANGGKISYDTNLRLKLWPLSRARAIIHDTVAHADICLPSLDEARQLTQLEEPEAIVDFYLERGAGIVALKMGSEGALIADGNARHRIAGFAVSSVDATGAGDTFDGAFVSMILAGNDLARAGQYANAAAALSTTGYGAVTPIPNRSAVEDFLAKRV